MRVGPILKPTPKLRERKPLKSRPHVIDWRIRQEVAVRDDGTCQWCGVMGGALDAHHVLRRSQGGKDEVANLKAVHRLCHRYIHEHPAEAKAREFLA